MKKSFIALALLLTCIQVNAEDNKTVQKPLVLRAETNAANMEMVVKDNFVKAKYASAENRYSQGNVKASYSDFADLIARAVLLL